MSEPGAYLLLGPEVGEKALFIESIEKKVAAAAGEEPEVHRLHAFDTQAVDLVSLLRNGALFSRHRLVIVRDAETFKRHDFDLLADYAKSPSKESTLVIVSEETKLDERFSKTIAEGARKVFWELDEGRKRSWIASYFAKAGTTIAPEAVELLLDMVDNDTESLRIEADRLVAFIGKGRELGTDEIETFLAHTRQESVFSLFDRIAAADFTSALDTLHSLLDSGEGNPIQILSGLLWQFRRLLALKRLAARGEALSSAYVQVKVFGKRNQATHAAALRLFELRDLERIIGLISDYDFHLKSQRSELHRLLLELFLYYSIVRRGRVPSPFRSSP